MQIHLRLPLQQLGLQLQELKQPGLLAQSEGPQRLQQLALQRAGLQMLQEPQLQGLLQQGLLQQGLLQGLRQWPWQGPMPGMPCLFAPPAAVPALSAAPWPLRGSSPVAASVRPYVLRPLRVPPEKHRSLREEEEKASAEANHLYAPRYPQQQLMMATREPKAEKPVGLPVLQQLAQDVPRIVPGLAKLVERPVERPVEHPAERPVERPEEHCACAPLGQLALRRHHR